jgi:hypothetical protein
MTGPHGKLPNWNVGRLRLVPVDPYVDPNLDTPARIAARSVSLETLERLRDTPVFEGCDDVEEEFLVLPQIHVRIRTSDREAAAKAILAHLVVHVGGLHVDGFVSYAIGPNVEVI